MPQDEETSIHLVTHEKPNRVDYWVDTLRNEGFGCLSGKFDPRWVINGSTLSQQIPRYAVQIFENGLKAGSPTIDFHPIFTFGSEDLKQSYNYFPSNQASAIGMMSEEKANKANYFIRSKPLDPEKDKFLINHAHLPAGLSSACYLMWESMKYTPDSRWHHVPMTFFFLLPSKKMDSLFSEIQAQPDLIDEIFKKMFPGILGEQTVHRLPTDTLRIIDLPENYISDYDKKKSLFTNPIELHFTHLLQETS